MRERPNAGSTVNTGREKAPTRTETQIGALPDGGRGGFRTPDRWCVKPELYH